MKRHIVNARVFDGEKFLDARTVTLEHQRIAAVGETPAAGEEVFDANGATLVPGLIDAHVHTSIDGLRDALKFGVTTELEMQGYWTRQQRKEIDDDDSLADVRSSLLALMSDGGHPSELMHDLGEHGPGEGGWTMPHVTTPDDAVAHVNTFVEQGADYLKVMIEEGTVMGHPGLPLIDPAAVKAGVDEAHRLGKKVIAHAITLEATRQAIDAGVDGLAHLFVDQRADERIVSALVEAGVFVAPCLVVSASLMGYHAAALADDPRVASRLSEPWLDTLRGSFNAYPQGVFQHVLDSVAALHAAGVDLLAGTDASIPVPSHGGVAHGASVHHELALLTEAGLSPSAAFTAATATPARCFGLTDRGRIAPGLRADLLLMDGDPFTTISDSLSVTAIWRRGTRHAA
ncbi:amidohydrolase family protein [Amycolatopsis jejuensis]|uniref:amidohydrolase family protein n=1 Tax=Amycolatopsis jejuensis TaxID=330084 RepID=UPI000AB751D5|nr:amidohydrolase family protein [Amycolatopsis jejuensis]